MNAVEKCPRCGAPVRGRKMGGLCRRCVRNSLFGGLKEFDDDLEPIQLAAFEPGATPFAPDDSHDEAVGQTIGRYKLREKIGEGGGGVVYVAEQTEPVRRKVALKLIKLGMDTKQVIARFEAERQALAMMDHPNIARVLDAGTTEGRLSSRPEEDGGLKTAAPIPAGRPYFVMELVPGIKITDFCDESKLSTRERLDLFIKVCHAIQHAHQKGIIHRDIKPSNVLVTLHDDEPVPKVIDFGIAKATEGRLTDATVYTQMQQFIGTPAYMSPEQAKMSGLDIDTRSDIYSLGVLLYELLAGSPPFDEKELRSMGLEAMCQTIREREPIRPSTRLRTLQGDELTTTAKRRASDVPALMSLLRGDLDWIVMKCLEKDRKRRYETANGLAADIQRHLNNEPVVARPPTFAYRFQKAFRRNKGAFAATAVVGFVLVLGVIASTWQAMRAERARAGEATQRQQAQAAQRLAESEQQRAKLMERSTRLRAYAADMNLVQRALELNDLGHARRLLDRYRPIDPDQEDIRGWEWRYLWKQVQSDAFLTLAKRETAITSLAASSDGKWLAESRAGRIFLLDLWSREEVRLGDGRGSALAFSPTEPVLAFASSDWSRGIQLVNAESHQEVGLMELPGYCPMITFAADGERLVALADNGSDKRGIFVFQVSDGRLLRFISFPDFSRNGFARTMALDRNGQRAFIGTESGEVVSINLTSGAEEWRQRVSTETIMSVAASPDGGRIAVGTGAVEATVAVMDQASGAELGRLKGHRAWIGRLVFLQGGRILASASADQTIRLWDPNRMVPIRVLRGHEREVWALTSLSDSRLASGSKVGELMVWDVSSSPGERAVALRPARHMHMPVLTFSPDSRSLFTVHQDTGQVDQWSGDNFRDREMVRSPGEKVGGVVMQPGGWRLAMGSTNGKVEILDLQNAVNSQSLELGEGRVEPVAFDQLRSVLWVRSGGEYQGYDFGETAPRRVISWPAQFSYSPADAQWRSSGKWMAGRKSGGIGFMDGTTGRLQLFPLKLGGINCASFSPDLRWFAIGAEPGLLNVWDISGLESGTEPTPRVTLSGAIMSYHGITFTPDSRRMAATSGVSQMVTLWDTESFESVLTLSGTGWQVSNVAFAPDGNTLASGGEYLHIWTAPSLDEIAAAEARDARIHEPR